MPRPDQESRNKGNGRYVRTPETAARDARAAELWGQGYTYREICAELDIKSSSNAYYAVRRALNSITKPAAEDARQRRAAELDHLAEEARAILARQHVTVSHGRIILDDDGQPLLDDGPKLAAIDRLLRINESQRKLNGEDAPTRISIDAEHLGQEIGELLNALTRSSDDADPEH